jgi:hypothetical protein
MAPVDSLLEELDIFLAFWVALNNAVSVEGLSDELDSIVFEKLSDGS